MTFTPISSSLAHVESEFSTKTVQVTHSEVAMSYYAISITVLSSLFSLVRRHLLEKTWISVTLGLYMYICFA